MLGHDRAVGSHAGHLRRGIAAVLVVAGVAMLAWSAVLLIDARVSQDAARQSLEAATRLHPPARPGLLADDEPMPPPAAFVVRGSPIGELLIPRVRLSSVVLHGSDTRTLRRGPGHIEYTAFPGERGNLAIAGHRDTFFRQLQDVQVGDDVFLNAPNGSFHYRITSTRVTSAHDLSVLDQTDRAVLTLITCYPFWVLGPAPDRFVIRAERIGEPTKDSEVHNGPISPTAQAPTTWSAVSVGLPAPERLAPPRPPLMTRATILDDETLIRTAIERFRGTYNGRLVRHNERRVGGPLTFSRCDVAITGDEADAQCPTVIDLWTLHLARAAGTWTIKSMAVTPLADRGTGEP